MVEPGPWTITDESTLVECYDQSVAAVYRSASRLTGGDRARTDDLVQEVYLQFVRAVRAGTVRTVGIGWLVTSARHRCSPAPGDVYELRRCAMPDAEIERRAGDGLTPTPTFVRDLRTEVQMEWRTSTTRPRRSWKVWGAAATAVLVVVGLAVVAGVDRAAPTSVPASSTAPEHQPEPSSTAPPTSAVPPTVLGHLWVVTQVDGRPVEGPDMPNFVFRAGDTLDGWDGCANFTLSPAGQRVPASACPDGTTAAPIHGPFTFDGEFDLHTDRIVAERFDRTDLEAPQLEGTYHFGDDGVVRLNPSGTGTAGGLEVEGAGCSISSGGVWSVTTNVLLFDLARPECAVGDATGAPNAFRAWLLQVISPGVTFSFHDGPAGGLWTNLYGTVTRLTRVLRTG